MNILIDTTNRILKLCKFKRCPEYSEQNVRNFDMLSFVQNHEQNVHFFYISAQHHAQGINIFLKIIVKSFTSNTC